MTYTLKCTLDSYSASFTLCTVNAFKVLYSLFLVLQLIVILKSRAVLILRSADISATDVLIFTG